MVRKTMNPYHAHVLDLAQGLKQLHRERRFAPATYRAMLKARLEADGWYCSTKFRVASRAAGDYYRGVLDLVCWPPPMYPAGMLPHPLAQGESIKDLKHRPPPVLVDFDKSRVKLKTRVKLAAFNYPASGRIVILTQANDSEECRGIDTIICLGVQGSQA